MFGAALPLAALALGGARAAASVVYFRAAPAEAPGVALAHHDATGG